MGQKSCVDRLSPELREKLLELLNNPAVTQAQIVDAINAEAGEPLISKSSLKRTGRRVKLPTRTWKSTEATRAINSERLSTSKYDLWHSTLLRNWKMQRKAET